MMPTQWIHRLPSRLATALAVLVMVCLTTTFAEAVSVGTGNVSTWKDGSTAAATLTIDDNNQPDHAWWVATGNTYDVKFTWFVITDRVQPTPNFYGTWQNFIDLKAAGHDIQSHTVDHLPAGPLPISQNYADAITAIETNMPGNDVLTLAYPNGLNGSNGNDRTIAGQHYIAARGVTGILNTLNGVDYLNVNSLTTDHYGTHGGFPVPGVVADTHFAYVPNLVNPAKPHYEGWLSVHSHGLTNDKEDAITGLLDYLTATPGDFWIAPFTDVAQYGQERDAASLSTSVISADEIQFTLTDTLDNAQFYQPLTVKVRVDNSWTDVIATQGGSSLPVTLIMDGGEQFALVNSVPDLGTVTLSLPAPGDYNADGTVDAADYAIWSNAFGSTVDLAADGNGDGTVDAADYTVWRDNQTPASNAIPEPTSLCLLASLASGMLLRSRR